MKKLILALILLVVVAIAALLVYQNRPGKRYLKTVTQARILSAKGKLEESQALYQQAGKIREHYEVVALEMLKIDNALSIKGGNRSSAIEGTQKFIETYPKNLAAKIILSQLSFDNADVTTAFNTINEVLQKDAHNFSARLLLAKVRERMGRLDLAEEQLRILYEAYPDSLDALMPMATNLLQQGKLVECRRFLSKVIEKEPNNNGALLLLTDTYLRQGNIDSAYKILDQWAESEGSFVQMVHVRKARILNRMGKLEEARKLLAKYKQFDRENIPALSEIAILQVTSGAYDSAITLYEKIADEFPRIEARSKLLAYYLYIYTGNYARALQRLKELRVSQGRTSHGRNLIMNYTVMGLNHKIKEFMGQVNDSLKATLTEFQKRVVPEKDFIHQWALLNYYRLNFQEQKTLEVAENMYKKWPNSNYVIDYYTAQLMFKREYDKTLRILTSLKSPTINQKIKTLQIHLYLKHNSKAIALARHIEKKHPYMGGVNLMLADYYRNSNKQKYIYHLKKELDLNPRSLPTLNNLAWEYGVEQKNYSKASPYIERLEEYQHGDPRIMDTIGWVLSLNKKYAEAEAYLKTALVLVPDNATMMYHLGWVKHKLNKNSEASKLLKKALRAGLIGPDKKEAKRIIATL